MTTLGIVGSGIAGLHLALYLQQQGIKATVYSDRSADEIRSGRLPNTVALMGGRGRATPRSAPTTGARPSTAPTP